MTRTIGRVVLTLVVCVMLTGAPVAAQEFADGFVYALHTDTAANGGSDIHGYHVHPGTGLVALPGFPVAAGGNGSVNTQSEGLIFDRTNRRLFTLNAGSRTVSGFAVNPTTGALTTLPFSPISLGAAPSPESPQCIAIHPSGSPLLVASRIDDGVQLNGRVYSFNLNGTSATASGSPHMTGDDTNPLSCEFSRPGDYFYTGGFDGQHFAGFAVDAATGILTPLPGSPFSSGLGPGAFATDDSGRLFEADISTTVRVFTTMAGVPSQASAAPSGLGITWDGILHQAGFYLVVGGGGQNVGVFQIGGSGTGTTLSAVSGSPFLTGGTNPFSLAVDDSGTLVFATNTVSRNLTTFQMNTSTGALTTLEVQPANTLGATGALGGLAFAPYFGPHLFDVDSDGRGDAFLYDPSTGAWRIELTNPSSTGFTEVGSTWDAGWRVHPAHLNHDGYTDMLLYDPVRGIWVQVMNTGGTGTPTYTVGNWDRDWQTYPADLNGDHLTDMFVYNPSTGVWVKCFVDGNGGFANYTAGQWDVGWSFTTGDFNGDGRDEFFLYNESNGVWVETFSQSGLGAFDYPASGQWDRGWSIYPANLNGDGRTDLFLYNASGINNSMGLNVTVLSRVGGNFDYPFVRQWDAGWQIEPSELNTDGRTDLFLYNPVTGVWVQAFSNGVGDFTYSVGQWDAGWHVDATDFNADGMSDMLVHNDNSGTWVQLLNGGGTFTQTNGNWGPGWDVYTR